MRPDLTHRRRRKALAALAGAALAVFAAAAAPPKKPVPAPVAPKSAPREDAAKDKEKSQTATPQQGTPRKEAAPKEVSPAAAPAAEQEPTSPIPPVEVVHSWDDEITAITDLLIDDRFAEAKDRLDRLLGKPNLPDRVAARARELRAKAEQKLAQAATPATPRPRIELPPAEGKPAGKAPEGVSFQVRQAVIGGGFEAGTPGQLSVLPDGLTFTPRRAGAQGWSVRWEELAQASKDEGIWDSPYPVVVAERGGRKHYIARVDDRGRYLPGDPIVAAIAAGRRPKQTPRKEAAGAGETGEKSSAPQPGAQEAPGDRTPEATPPHQGGEPS